MIIETQVAIVGAGPIGLELAIALKQAGVDFIQFDKGQIGQMIFNFPVQTPFFSSSDRIAIAGVPLQTLDQQKCSREEYLAYLRSVVMQYKLQVNTYEEVSSIKKNGSSRAFDIYTQSQYGQRHYRASYVVLATGGTAFSRMLNVPGENLPNVSTKMSDPHVYFQKKVVIIGSKNSAAEAALRCFHAGAKVTMVMRKKEFDSVDVKYWILPELLGRIKAGDIDCKYGAKVDEIHSDGLFISSTAGGPKEDIKADFVIKAIGFEADMSLCENLGVILAPETKVPTFDTQTMETNIPNVWVAGTATGGTQKRFKVFIENCHEHVEKILQSLCIRLGKESRPVTNLISAHRNFSGPAEE